MKLPPYPKYKPSGVKWLDSYPIHWVRRSLKHLVSTPITDGPHETPQLFDEGVPFVSVESVSDGRVHLDSRRGNISERDHAKYSRKYCPRRDDLYVVKSGSTTGKVAHVDFSEEFNIWSPLAAIRCDQAIALPRFVFYALSSPYFQRLVQVSWSFGTQPNIGMAVLQNLEIAVAPLDEQAAIATFLDRETGRIDRLIGKQRELVELLGEKRRALISRCVTRGLPPAAAKTAGLNPHPKLKPSGIDWLGEIPEHWDTASIKQVFVNLDRRRIPIAGELRASIDKIFPYYGASGIIDYVDDYIFDEALILVAEDGANLLSRSSPLAFMATGKYWVNNHAHILRPRKGDIRYWVTVLQTYDYTPLVTGAAQPKLTSDRLSSVDIPCPPDDEQIAIANYLDVESTKLDRLIAKAEELIERLREYRTALITAAVTGKIDVRQHVAPQELTA